MKSLSKRVGDDGTSAAPSGDALATGITPSGARQRPAEGRPVLGTIGRYELIQELGRGATGIVYEACDRESRAVVALKTLVSMDAENLFRLKHEFRSLSNLEHENLVRFGELASDGHQLYFTMERVYGPDFLGYVRPRDGRPGSSNDSHVRAQKGAAGGEDRLRHALAQLVEALAAVHETGRIHRDVKPSNVLVTNDGRVVLLDFGVATAFGASEGMTGTPTYMAPEQILSEELTPATDWYAVGVMIYAALTGNLPFSGEVPAILQAKVDEEGPSTDTIDGPEDLRALCGALMKRAPADRPGVDEIRARLGLARPSGQMREVFVGREAELARLRDALARTQTSTQAVVVRGEAGMGKSSLVEHFLAEIRTRAIVLRGRCYEQENVPFGGVDSLVDALSEYLLGLLNADVDRLIGGGVSNVARVFPVLCRVPLVAAQRTDGPVLNATTLREQAFGELTRILGALGRTHTLVLFLDDLQWIDADSLALLRSMLQSKAVRILFVATLRAENAPSAELEALLAGVERVDISRLSSEESSDVVRSMATLQGDVHAAVLREAAGHPLFLAELLRSARAGKLEQHASARLQDVLWDRVSERDETERLFLEMAAVAGAPTPYGVLAQAAGLDLGECATRIAGLRAAQLVRVSRVDDERCVEPYHDRVREAVMERVRAHGETHVAQRHLALGRALLDATQESRLSSRIFSIVQHLNLGRDLMDSEAERRRLAELDLVAGRHAYLSTAFDRARDYARLGLEQLGADAWASAYSTCRDLHLVLMESECVLGQRDAAQTAFDASKGRLQTPEEKASLYAVWINFETTAGRFQEALAAGREVLGQLGASIPARATKFHILKEFAKVRWAHRGRTAEALESLPESHDTKMDGSFEVLSALCPPAFFVEPDLLPWLMLYMARLTFKVGVSRWASTGVGGYGMTLTGAFGKREEGLAFGRLAVKLADRYENPRMQPEAHFVMGNFLLPWVRPFDESHEEYKRTFDLATKYGVTHYEIYPTAQGAGRFYNAGGDLREMKERALSAREIALQRNSDHLASLSDCVLRYAGSLRGETPALDDTTLTRSSHSECLYQLLQADRAYLVGDARSAEPYLAEARKTEAMAFCMPHLVDLRLIAALVSARLCDDAPLLARARRKRQIASLCGQLDSFAASCPANFEAHALLARAELARVSGRIEAAADLYERAAASAREHGAIKREAIAHELAMRLARARGDAKEAARRRDLAIDAYERWGATVKVRALRAES